MADNLHLPCGDEPLHLGHCREGEMLYITENGEYDVDGYVAVDVNVANSYSAGDEGKVVSGGALVTQGSQTVTNTGTYDTTLISSLTVNIASLPSASGNNF